MEPLGAMGRECKGPCEDLRRQIRLWKNGDEGSEERVLEMRGARRGCEGQRLPLARAGPAPSPTSEPRRVHGPGVLTSARGPRLGVAARDPPSRAAARRALPPSRAAARLLKRRVNDSPSFLMCNHAVLHSDRNGTRVLTSGKVRLLSGECDGKSAAALVEIQMRGALPRHIGEPRGSVWGCYGLFWQWG